MAEVEKVRHLLDRAEQAAMGGDFVSAEELLKRAATIQEQELGPRHPDLANTLNNLAIVAEKTGRIRDAESLYRRAAAIAGAALPRDHPMVAETKQNLEDFCHAHGVPVDARAPVGAAADTGITEKPAPPATVAPRPNPPPPAPVAPIDVRPAATTGPSSHRMAWLAVGAVLIVALALLLLRPWSSGESSMQVQSPEPKTARPADAVPPPTSAAPSSPAPAPAPIGRPSPPKGTPRERDRQVAADQPSPRGAVALAVAQVCRSFSTRSSTWRCDPVGGSVRPGPIVLYTRVKSPRDTAVVHRWYHGNTLRQSVKLAIRGNATEGYRTYSRQTVTDGDWRVEVRSLDGTLLHEERFAVR